MPHNLANKKLFYENHSNFSMRTLIDYYISPGTMVKFEIIKTHLGNHKFYSALDVGCSGNSILPFLSNIRRKSFLELAHLPLKQYLEQQNHHPVEGSITQLPYKSNQFDLICALDVIEHVYNDKLACDELIRILKPNGILLISVPHRMKFYTRQDMLIGHYRRYEIIDLNAIFKERDLEIISNFGVYGQIMRWGQYTQAKSPENFERDLQQLRKNYIENPLFRKLWDKFVYVVSKFMKWDAKFQPTKNLMNICAIYQKKNKSI